MNRQSAGILGAALFLSLITSQAFHGTAPGTPAAARQAGPVAIHQSVNAATGTDELCPQEGILDAIRMAYGTGRTPLASECKFGPGLIEGKRTGFMVALVPDPRHTHLELMFDRSIDAIEEGVQNSELVFEQSWMPWDSVEHRESDNFLLRDGEQEEVRDRERLPGILIFRRANSGARWDKLVVFVVGEKPTSGINKDQFRNATSYVAALAPVLENVDEESPQGTLRISGPTFSGSFPSLADLLACKEGTGYPCNARILVLSGTVTGRSSIDDFKTRIQGRRIEFASFQHSDDYAIENLLVLLHDNDYDLQRVALLSEDETAYGDATEQMQRAAPAELLPNRPSLTTDPEHHAASLGECKADGQRCIPKLYFPRGISHLRAAYQHGPTAADNGTEHVPRSVLPLDLVDTGNDDTVPPYAQRQTPISQEAILQGIVTELDNDRIQYILLRATDPLDELFLAQYLRSNYPNARIVTVGADLLFPREIADGSLHGILALSSYSLTPGGEHGTAGTEAADHIFPSDNSVGLFNATTALLAATLPKDGGSAATYFSAQADTAGICGDALTVRDHTHLFDYAWGFGSGVTQKHYKCAPLHLLVLGHSGYWGVADLGVGSAARSQVPAIAVAPGESTNRIPQAVHLPLSWQVAQVLTWLIAVSFVMLTLQSSVLGTSEAAAHFGPTTSQSRPEEVAIGAYVIVCALLLLLWPYRYPTLAWSTGSVVIIVAAAVMVCAAALLNFIGPAYSRLRRLFVTSVVVTAIVIASPWEASPTRLLEVRRSMHLTSGVSPALPLLLLLAALLWWAWYTFTGTTLLDDRKPRLPGLEQYSGPIATSLRPISGEEQTRLMRLLAPGNWFSLNDLGLRMRIEIPAIAVMAVVVWLADKSHPLRTFEEHNYERLIGALILGILYLLAASAFRLQAIWQEFRALLNALDSYPIRSAFRNVKGFSWTPLWNMGSGSLGEFQRLLSRQFETMRCALVRAGGQLGAADTNRTFTALLRTYDLALQRRAAGILVRAPHKYWKRRVTTDTVLIQRLARLQVEVGRVATEALLLAANYWPTREAISFNGDEKSVREELMPLGVAVAALHSQSSIPACYPFLAFQQDRERQKQETEQMIGACEQFVAYVYLNFILVVVVRIRTLILAISGIFVFLSLALSVYPFEPQVVLRSAMAALFVGLIWIVGTVYAQMHRDSTLSHITDTTPGELGLDFWIRIATFVALPVLSLVAWGFPEFNNFLFSWVEPATQAIR